VELRGIEPLTFSMRTMIRPYLAVRGNSQQAI